MNGTGTSHGMKPEPLPEIIGAMDSDVVQLRTGAHLVTDVTQVIVKFCRERGDGLCHVFVPHATAGVALMETGSGSESDLEDAIDRLLPRRGHLPAPARQPWSRP